MEDEAAQTGAGPRRGAGHPSFRFGGTAHLSGGQRLVWSVAEGRRGRRWRWAIVDDGGLSHAVLLELDPTGRLSRLEVASASGLLTLHPEPDFGSLHGNLVTPNGIEHLAFRWSPTMGVDVVDAFGPFVLAASLGASLGVGESLELETLGLDRFLRPVAGVARLSRHSPEEWSLAPGTPPGRRRSPWTGSFDHLGRPALPGGRIWPLELH